VSRIAALAAFALACAALFTARLNHDTALYLVGARRMLEGARLYVDIIEVNPPLMFWAMAPVARAGAALGLPDAHAAGAFVSVLLAASGLLAWRLLALEPAPPPRERAALVGAFFLVASLTQLLEVAQRDPAAGILLFPYALLAGRACEARVTPVWLRVSCGVLAALGVAVKPYFVLPWLALELVVVLRRRSVLAALRIESLAVAVGQLVYAVAVLTVTPEYASRVVPLAALNYGAYEISRWYLLTVWPVLALIVCGLGAWWGARRLGPARPPFAEPLLVLAAGFLATFLWQAKGFGYHLQPVTVFATTAMLAVFLPARRAQSSLVTRGCALASIGMLAIAAAELRNDFTALRVGQLPEVRELTRIVEQAGPGAPVFALSTTVWPAFPTVNLAHARWPYRYNSLWPLPGFYRSESDSPRAPESQGPEERAFFDGIVAELVATPPRVLIVDRSPTKWAIRAREFDFVTYFAASPRFESLMRGYRSMGRVGDYEVFEPM
jgi:hypothetical protein